MNKNTPFYIFGVFNLLSSLLHIHKKFSWNRNSFVIAIFWKWHHRLEKAEVISRHCRIKKTFVFQRLFGEICRGSLKLEESHTERLRWQITYSSFPIYLWLLFGTCCLKVDFGINTQTYLLLWYVFWCKEVAYFFYLKYFEIDRSVHYKLKLIQLLFIFPYRFNHCIPNKFISKGYFLEAEYNSVDHIVPLFIIPRGWTIKSKSIVFL